MIRDACRRERNGGSESFITKISNPRYWGAVFSSTRFSLRVPHAQSCSQVRGVDQKWAPLTSGVGPYT